MGGLAAKLVFKKGKDKYNDSKYGSLLDIPATDIDGN